MTCACGDDCEQLQVIIQDSPVEVVFGDEELVVELVDNQVEVTICDDEITILELESQFVVLTEDEEIEILDFDDEIEVIECCVQGPPGPPGVGVPPGGTANQVLAKIDNDDYDTEWVDPPTGGGAVDSVNGQTGVVVLDATDVGADPSGSSAQALTDANNYTDTQIGSLGFLESIVPGAGVTVDDTDPQNPIISATALPDVIYFLQDQETTSTYAYVGYESADNDWYIYRRTRATNVREYATGASSYATNWTGRSGLTYV